MHLTFSRCISFVFLHLDLYPNRSIATTKLRHDRCKCTIPLFHFTVQFGVRLLGASTLLDSRNEQISHRNAPIMRTRLGAVRSGTEPMIKWIYGVIVVEIFGDFEIRWCSVFTSRTNISLTPRQYGHGTLLLARDNFHWTRARLRGKLETLS